MTELKPCPFCGGENLRVCEPFDPEDETFVVTCDGCNAEGPYFGGSDSTTETEAIAAWNTRTPDPALLALVGELEDRAEALGSPELTDVEAEAALVSEGIYTWGPDGERFERMFAVVMQARATLTRAKETIDA